MKRVGAVLLFFSVLHLATSETKGSVYSSIMHDNNHLLFQNNEASEYLVEDAARIYKQLEFLQNGDNLKRVLSSMENKAQDSSSTCSNNLKIFAEGLLQGKPWARQMIDAQAKPGAGIGLGNLFWTGSYYECRNTTAHDMTGAEAFKAQYCVLTQIPKQNSNKFLKGVTFRLGMCLPGGCSVDDINAFLFEVRAEINATVGVEIPMFFATCNEDHVPLDSRATVAILICSIIGCLVLLGTVYDISQQMRVKKGEEKDSLHVNATNGHVVVENGTSNHATSTEVTGEQSPLLPGRQNNNNRQPRAGTLGKVLLAFSAYSNGRRLLATGAPQEGQLPAVHGVRFISMCWVILGHTYAFCLYSVSNGKVITDWEKRFSFQVIDNAYFAVDSFFVLSGLLLVYLVMREREKKGRVNWAMFYIHRVWRLTPVYMLVMMVDVCLLRYMGNGPYWPQSVGFEKDFCKDTWWTNLLYVNNFVYTDKMCMVWSWYLANDMQLFCISPLILIPLFSSVYAGGAVMAGLLVTHVITNAVITQSYELGAGGIMDPKSAEFMNYLYYKPYTRVGPYVIGMMTGYFLYVCKGRFRAHKGLIALAWVCCGILAVITLYGLVESYNGSPLPEGWIAAYNAFSRPAWALAVSWVIFACCTGNGGFVNTILSWRAIVPLSRLTYCAYLVHPIVMFLNYFNADTPLNMTDISMMYNFIGNFACAFLVAFVTSLCFESPMMGLEKALWKK